MRKLFFLLAFLCCAVTQLKADVIQPSTTPYYPEHVYTMMNANGWYANATTHGTQTAAEAGHFAFYPVSGVENAYYIYSVDNNQWLTYTKAASYSNTRNFISVNSSFGIDDYFYLNQRQNGYYDIAPYNNTGIASKYLNWFEGANESHTTIGLWQQNLIDDPGSKFSFTEVTIDSEEIPYFTITSEGRGTWIVSKNMTSWYFQTSANLDASNELQHFAFIKKNGNVYLYNKGISKYINKDHNFSDEPTDGITFLYGDAIDKDKESNLNTDNNFVICFDNSHFINLGGDRQIIIDGWGPNSASNGDGKTDIGNCLTITKQGTFTIAQPEPEPEPEPEPDPEVSEDRSEELAPNFGKVDIQGIKVCADNGSFSVTTDDQYYQVWESNAKEEYWAGKVNDEVIYNTPSLVSIKSIKDATKDLSYRFHYDGSDPHRVFHTLTNVGTGMLIEAAEGYNIVGYCFDYTATDDIKDFTSYEGEITSTAGTHHVEVNGLDARSTEILFGTSSSGDIVISNFYVFIRKGMQLTEANYSKWSNMVYIPYAFTLAPYNNPDLQLYAPENSEYLDACGSECKKYSDVKVSGTDLRQQFVFIPFENYQITYPAYNGMYFVYNLGEKKFISAQDGKAILTEYPLQAAEIEMCQEEFKNCFRINFNKTNLLNVSTEDCSQEPTSSCVNTSNNEHDGGNHFYLRAVRIFDYESGGDVMNQIFLESNRLDDQTIIDEKGAEVAAILDKDGPGYPTDELRSILIQHYNNITLFKEATALFQLGQFLPTYKSTTSVKMPETGKAYRIKTHYMGNKGRYLKAAEDGKLTIVNEGQEEADNTTVFVVKSMDTAKDGEGTYAIVGENGQFLVGARTGTEGFVSSYNGTNTGSLQLTTAANKGDYFGGFLLKTTEGTNTYNLQLGTTTNNTEMVITYDAENPGSIINDPNGGSSIFYLEEVNDYPNVVKLREPAVADGKAYSSIWLPFSVEIPEGVRAYKAHVDYTTNQLVCGEVKNILPGGQGAILISEDAQEIVLAPATADVAPLEKNDLKGTNVTVARNTDVTTFVLNGGKGEIGFYPYTGTNIAKYKAYVEVDKAQAAQGLRFSFGTATDIENTLTEGEGEAKEYYDLSGRRVAQPTKGLYIVNGKKMYIK